VFVFVVNVFRGKVIFDHLVLHNTHAGFLYRQLGQRDPFVVGSQSGFVKNPVYLFLGESCIFSLGSLHLLDQGFQLG
jgi:hypothetical protein